MFDEEEEEKTLLCKEECIFCSHLNNCFILISAQNQGVENEKYYFHEQEAYLN
jgi:hypothetical protein